MPWTSSRRQTTGRLPRSVARSVWIGVLVTRETGIGALRRSARLSLVFLQQIVDRHLPALL